MDITPINNHVLVELVEQYGSVSTISKQYETRTSGKIIAVDKSHPDWKSLVGKTGYWEGFKDANTIMGEGGKKYALIKHSDIGGIK